MQGTRFIAGHRDFCPARASDQEAPQFKPYTTRHICSHGPCNNKIMDNGAPARSLSSHPPLSAAKLGASLNANRSSELPKRRARAPTRF